MQYEYKGQSYEFPDTMPEDQALSLMKKDQGEITPPEPAITPAPSVSIESPKLPEGTLPTPTKDYYKESQQAVKQQAPQPTIEQKLFGPNAGVATPLNQAIKESSGATRSFETVPEVVPAIQPSESSIKSQELILKEQADLKNLQRRVKEIAKHPIETAKGLRIGILSKLTKQINNVSSFPLEKLGIISKEDRDKILSDFNSVDKALKENLIKESVSPTATKAGLAAGEVVPPIAESMALYFAAPGGMILKNIIAETPFIGDAIETGKIKSNLISIALNTGIDLLTRGNSRAIAGRKIAEKLIENGTEKKIANKVADEIVNSPTIKKSKPEDLLKMKEQQAVKTTIAGKKIEDISFDEFKKLSPEEQQLVYEANPITGRKGMRAFKRVFKKATENETKPVYVGFGDVNGAKVYNDKISPEFMDRLNAEIYDNISKHADPEVHFNLHGDEFVIYGDNPDAVASVLKNAMEDLGKKPIEYNGKTYNPTMSWAIGKAVKFKDVGKINPKTVGKNKIAFDKTVEKPYTISGATIPEENIVTRKLLEAQNENIIPNVGNDIGTSGIQESKVPTGNAVQSAVEQRRGLGETEGGANTPSNTAQSVPEVTKKEDNYEFYTKNDQELRQGLVQEPNTSSTTTSTATEASTTGTETSVPEVIPPEAPQGNVPPIKPPETPVSTGAIPEDMYAKNREVGGKKVHEPILPQISKTISRAIGVLSTEAKLINPEIKTALRKHDQEVRLNTQKSLSEAKQFTDTVNKMSKEDKLDLDFAAKNADENKILSVMDKYGAKETYNTLRKTLDDVRNRAEMEGIPIGYIDTYFPRKVINYNGLKEHMVKTGQWANVEKEVARKQAEHPQYPVTDEEVEALMNKVLRGRGKGEGGIGYTKERKVEFVDPEMNKYYDSFTNSIVDYINRMEGKIAEKKFFGKNSIYDPETGVFNAEKTIGSYVADMIKEGKLDVNKETRLMEILDAYFRPKSMNKALAAYRNLEYGATLGGPKSVVTQLQDASFNIAHNGIANTLHAFFVKNKLKPSDIGVDDLAYEMAETARSSKYAKGALTFLSGMDNLFNKNFITADMLRYQKKAKGSTKVLYDELEPIFKDRTQSVIESFKKGELTPDTKFALFNDILEYKPLTRTEIPEIAAKGGNAAMMYMMKRYQIKQLDVYRNQVFHKLRYGTPKEKIEAAKNFAKLTGLLLATGVTTDQIKDIMDGRDFDLKESTVENLFRIAGLTRYSVKKIKQQGLMSGIAGYIAPPVKMAESVVRDIGNAVSGKMEDVNSIAKMNIWRNIPFVGEEYYWWFGGGKERKEAGVRKELKTKLTKETAKEIGKETLGAMESTGYKPGIPSDKVMVRGEEYKLTDDEYKKYVSESTKLFKERVGRTALGKEIDLLNPKREKKGYSNIMRNSRKAILSKILRKKFSGTDENSIEINNDEKELSSWEKLIKGIGD